MDFAIILSGGKNQWQATIRLVDLYERCQACNDHSKPDLSCAYVESKFHENPLEAITQVILFARQRADYCQGDDAFSKYTESLDAVAQGVVDLIGHEKFLEQVTEFDGFEQKQENQNDNNQVQV